MDVKPRTAEHLDAIKQLEGALALSTSATIVSANSRKFVSKTHGLYGMEKLVPLAAAAATIETPVASLEKGNRTGRPTAIN
ncbi:MAG: hypothetical protein U0105_06430 [Candidatus Obscuribacterales bacterium]